MQFNNLPEFLKPREKAYLFGITKLSDIELLAIILRTGTRQEDVLELAKKLLAKFQTFKRLLTTSLEELTHINGLGKVKALELKTIFEIHKRIKTSISSKIITLNDVINLAWRQIHDWEHECFVLILLDNKKNLLFCETLYKASKNHIVIQPKDIIALVLKKEATHFYCIHNHPSGNINPSEKDRVFTMRMRYLCQIMQLNLLEHLIICQNKTFAIIH